MKADKSIGNWKKIVVTSYRTGADRKPFVLNYCKDI